MIYRTPVPTRATRRGWSGRFLLASVLVALVASFTCGATASRAVASAPPQALVLDPFPAQHSPGYDGADITTDLQSAGFQVTVLHGSQVTVSAMLQLAHYSVIYIYTHSGPLPNNDAAVSTGDTRHHRYSSYFATSSLVRMHIQNNGQFQEFDAITGRFIHRYVGRFLPHTLVMLNACTALGMPLFWKYLKASGVGTFISWQHHVNTVDADLAAHDLFAALDQGQTVDQAIHTLTAAGAGTSTVKGKIGSLGFRGAGGDTLQAAETAASTGTP